MAMDVMFLKPTKTSQLYSIILQEIVVSVYNASIIFAVRISKRVIISLLLTMKLLIFYTLSTSPNINI